MFGDFSPPLDVVVGCGIDERHGKETNRWKEALILSFTAREFGNPDKARKMTTFCTMSVHILILLFTSLFLKSADYLICIKIWVSGFALLLRCEGGDTGQQTALNQAKTIPCKKRQRLVGRENFSGDWVKQKGWHRLLKYVRRQPFSDRLLEVFGDQTELQILRSCWGATHMCVCDHYQGSTSENSSKERFLSIRKTT